jgi:hypothetical protein
MNPLYAKGTWTNLGFSLLLCAIIKEGCVHIFDAEARGFTLPHPFRKKKCNISSDPYYSLLIWMYLNTF